MKKQLCLLSLSAALAVAATTSPAQAAAYMKLGDIKGEATEAIEIESWSWGASNAAAAPNQNSSRSNHTRSAEAAGDDATAAGSMHRDHASGMATGKRQHSPLTLAKPLLQDGTVKVVAPREVGSGQATGKRMTCAVGTHYSNVTLKRGLSLVELTDLIVTECGDGTMTMSYVTAEEKAEETGVPATRATKSRSNIQNN